MDIFAHGFWSYFLFYKDRNKFLAILFGVLPDLLSFGILFLANLPTFLTSKPGPPDISTIPQYVHISYNLTHSLIIAFIVILLVYIITKKFHYFLLTWPLHIFIDIFTHTKEFFPTPFLYPISNFKLNGISWANPTFMAINYSLILLAIIYIIWKKKKS
jgi:hypothetical protein